MTQLFASPVKTVPPMWAPKMNTRLYYRLYITNTTPETLGHFRGRDSFCQKNWFHPILGPFMHQVPQFPPLRLPHSWTDDQRPENMLDQRHSPGFIKNSCSSSTNQSPPVQWTNHGFPQEPGDGYESKPWYPSEPQITGKWMFTPPNIARLVLIHPQIKPAFGRHSSAPLGLQLFLPQRLQDFFLHWGDIGSGDQPSWEAEWKPRGATCEDHNKIQKIHDNPWEFPSKSVIIHEHFQWIYGWWLYLWL